MNFLSQMLPGFRHVRAPLISGYIWLFVAWLLLSDELPRKHESAVYGQAYELGEAVGTIGLALVASITAYLVGSLVQVVIASLADGFSALRRSGFRRHWYGSVASRVTAWEVLAPPLLDPEGIGWFDGDGQTKARLRSLTESQLADSQEALRNAVGAAEEQVTNGLNSVRSSIRRDAAYVTFGLDFKSEAEPIVDSFAVEHGGRVVSSALPETHELPIYSASRNMFEERGGIKTLLMETTAQAGSEVERLYSEAELRLAVALPLIALMIVLWAESGDAWWLALLAAPVGLLYHAMVLGKHGGLEMVEALRSRDPKELKKIAPAFDRYRTNAKDLAAAVRDFPDWTELARQLALQEAPPLSFQVEEAGAPVDEGAPRP